MNLDETMVQTDPSTYTVAVPAAVTLIAPFDATRTSLFIQTVAGHNVWIGWKNDNLTDNGIVLALPATNGQPSLDLNVRDHGRLVTGPVYAMGITGAATVFVAESRSKRGPL